MSTPPSTTGPSPIPRDSCHPHLRVPSGPPEPLTAAETVRIEAALAANYADSTRATYACAWRTWAGWCRRRGAPALPGAPLLVCAYLVQRADDGLSAATLELACSAISYQHRQAGVPDPIGTETVRLVRRGLRSRLGTAARRPARALTTEEINQIVTPIDRSTAKGARDAALILLGFASALRVSELSALTLADLERQPAGLLLHLPRSKTDPEAHGQTVGVAHGRHPATDPIAALDRCLQVRRTTTRSREPGPGESGPGESGPGESLPVFTGRRSDADDTTAIRGSGISRMVRERARAAGLDDPRITGHSLRAGHATTAARAGVPIDRIAAPDPAPSHRRPHRALHPPRPGPRHHLQPRPRALTETRTRQQTNRAPAEARAWRRACLDTPGTEVALSAQLDTGGQRCQSALVCCHRGRGSTRPAS
jgi:integrase